MNKDKILSELVNQKSFLNVCIIIITLAHDEAKDLMIQESFSLYVAGLNRIVGEIENKIKYLDVLIDSIMNGDD